ncbi:MAG: glutaredoxin 3 [Pseudomonadota bacterium]|nr:glutaredoxin 3 [Pseudomonadota bacterium]
MKKVVIYTTGLCPFCILAKRLFTEKDVDYREIDILRDPGSKAEMIEKSGGRTSVPQIFVDGFHVGGADDLYALEEEGRLDNLLGLA